MKNCQSQVFSQLMLYTMKKIFAWVRSLEVISKQKKLEGNLFDNWIKVLMHCSRTRTKPEKAVKAYGVDKVLMTVMFREYFFDPILAI